MNIGKFNSFSIENKNILNIIRLKGPITKGEMCKITDLPLTTLNRFIEPLEKSGIICEAGTCESTGGRKPVLYDFNRDFCYAIGIEISRFSSSVAIVDSQLNYIHWENFRMNKTLTPEATFNRLSASLMNFFEKNKLVRDRIIGIGVGAVGPLDRDAGVLLNPKYFKSKGWENVNIKLELENRLNIPVIIDNGANAALLAEQTYGSGRDFENIAYFNIGLGLRTAALANGVLVRGINDSEDAFGHMIVDVDGDQCICGNYGCVETAASARAIYTKFVSERRKGRNTVVLMNEEELNVPYICQAAEDGDSLSKEIIEGAATIFGAGLANYINLLNPQIVILSGPIISSSEIYFNIAKEVALKKRYLKETNQIFIQRMGKFREKAIALGAGGMVMEEYFR